MKTTNTLKQVQKAAFIWYGVATVIHIIVHLVLIKEFPSVLTISIHISAGLMILASYLSLKNERT